VVAAAGNLDYFSYAPYLEPHAQLSVSATAMQSTDAGARAGFGVICRRGTGDARVSYEFALRSDGSWTLDRHDGAIGPKAGGPTTLRSGSSSGAPGALPVTVRANCATQADGTTTQLAFYVNGSQVADLTDVDKLSAGVGWTGGTEVVGVNQPFVVVFSNFEERDVSL
jgi:hypothetical protein